MGLMIFKINPTLIEVGVNQDAGNAMYFAYGVWLVHFFGFLVLPPSLFFDTSILSATHCCFQIATDRCLEVDCVWDTMETSMLHGRLLPSSSATCTFKST